MKARVDAAKYLVYAAALKKQEAMNGQKVRYSVEAAEAKLIASRTASDVTRRPAAACSSLAVTAIPATIRSSG